MGNSLNKNNIFPDAKKTDKKFYKSQLAYINAGKSKLANHILEQIQEYSICGNNIEVDLEKFESTEAERNAIKRLLSGKGWGVRLVKRKFKSEAEYEKRDKEEEQIKMRRQNEFSTLKEAMTPIKKSSKSEVKKTEIKHNRSLSQTIPTERKKTLKSHNSDEGPKNIDKTLNISDGKIIQYTLETNDENDKNDTLQELEEDSDEEKYVEKIESSKSANSKSISGTRSISSKSGKITRIYWILYKMAIVDMI
jgi:hypothetical protein